MRSHHRSLALAGFTAVFGIAAAVIRSLYFKMAAEPDGFLTPWHPVQILFWILAGGQLLGAVLLSRGMPSVKRQAPMGIRTGMLQVLLSGALALTVLGLNPDARMAPVVQILGAASAVVLLADGICRCLNKSLFLLPHSLLCIFLLVYCVSSYGRWSNVPEMERILVPAAGIILLLPFSCEMAYWDQGQNHDRNLRILGAMTAFFCLAAIGGPGLEPLHLGGLIIALNALYSLSREGEK